MQNAINTAVNGDTVNLLGNPLAENITINGKDITIQGNGFTLDGGYTFPTGGTTYPCANTVVSGILTLDRTRSALIKVDNVTDLTIDGLNITQSRGEAIRIDNSSGVTVRNSSIYDNRARGLVAIDASDILWDNMDLFGNMNFAPFSRGASTCNWGAATAMVRVTDSRITSSRVRRNWGEGFVSTATSNIELDNNYYWDNFSANLYLHWAVDMTVHNNVVWHSLDNEFNRGGDPSNDIVFNMEDAFSGNGYDTNNNIRVFNNLVITRNQGISLWGNNQTNTTSNIRVYNNTVIANSEGAPLGSLGNLGSGAYTGGQVYNNIFYGEGAATDAVHPGNDYDWNLWSSTPQATAQGTNDVIGAPSLVNLSTTIANGTIIPDPADYYQVLGSPSLDVGTNSLIASDDFPGTARPQNATVDMGFHEFTDVVVNDPPVIFCNNQTNTVGDTVSVSPCNATDPENDPLTYFSTTLPAGLSINNSTGEVTGTITAAAGTYTVTVTVVEPNNPQGASTTFTWTVEDEVGIDCTSCASYQGSSITDNSTVPSVTNGVLTLDLSCSDCEGTATWEIDPGDGSGVQTVSAGTFTYTYAQTNSSTPYPVSVKLICNA